MAILYNIKAPESTLLYKISTGSAGPRGEAGPAGSAGPKGDPGTSIVGMDSIAVGDDVVVTIHTSDNTSYSYTVPQGKEGPQGPQGEPGPKGDKGDVGSQGPEGKQGPQGEAGPGITDISSKETDTGAEVTLSLSNGKSTTFTLDNGPQGKQGPKGDTGSEGPKGDKGETGSQGPVGPKGDQGVGITSITEDTSSEDGGINTITFALSDGSTQNATVKNGSKGSQGPQGIQGEKGSEGPKGEQGFSPTITQEAYVSPTENWKLEVSTPSSTTGGDITVKLYKNDVLYNEPTYVSVSAGPATPELTLDNKGTSIVPKQEFTGSASWNVIASQISPQYLAIFYKDSGLEDLIGYTNAYTTEEAKTVVREIKQEPQTGTKVTITNESSTDSFIVYDGSKGSNGSDGASVSSFGMTCTIDDTDVANGTLPTGLYPKKTEVHNTRDEDGNVEIQVDLELKADHLFPVEGIDYNISGAGSNYAGFWFSLGTACPYGKNYTNVPLIQRGINTRLLQEAWMNIGNIGSLEEGYSVTSYTQSSNSYGLLATEWNSSNYKIYYNFSPFALSYSEVMCCVNVNNAVLKCTKYPLFGSYVTFTSSGGRTSHAAEDIENSGGIFRMDSKSQLQGDLTWAFANTGFETIDFGGTVNNWSTKADNMFYNCQYLKSLVFKKFDNSFGYLTSATDIFYGCTKLSELSLPYNFGNNTELMAFSLTPCIALTKESVVDGVFNNLATRANSPTLQLSSTTKALLSDDDIAIATNKGWVVS